MGPLQRFINFLRYLAGNKSELKRINRNDALLAKVVVDIHRKRAETEFILTPLHSILPIHPIDRGEALRSKEKRVRRFYPGAAYVDLAGIAFSSGHRLSPA